MKLPILSFLFFMLAWASCNNADKKATATIPEQSQDEAAIKKAVDDAYAVLYFKPGEKFDYEHIRTAFVPQAHFLDFRSDTLEYMSLNDIVKGFKTLVDSNHITSFYEEEIFGKTTQFGKIAQRISTYTTYINTRDSAAERGVNSFQLVKTPTGWKVSSIIWDVERAGQAIPPYYLQPDSTK